MESGKQGGFRAAVIVAAFAAALTGCGRSPDRGGRMAVAASIAPLADFARQVGGDRVKVDLLVPPGSNPHTYQVQPDQMTMLSKASVLVLNGVGLEFWAANVIDAANNPKLIVVRTADGLDIVGHEEHGAAGNPHVWLDPIDAIHQVGTIRDAFVKADPSRAAYYRTNAARYVARLKALDAHIRSQVAGFKSRSFVSFHPTWVYFARRYGLTEAAAIEPSPGKEPSPQDVRRAIDTATKLRAKAIFAEPQMSRKAAQVVAEEAGAKVVLLDAFGKPPSYDYIRTMRANIRAMTEAMK